MQEKQKNIVPIDNFLKIEKEKIELRKMKENLANLNKYDL